MPWRVDIIKKYGGAPVLEDAMPRGNETKYTDKQIRKADRITESTRADKRAIATAPSAKVPFKRGERSGRCVE
jgi:hypothetical protein